MVVQGHDKDTANLSITWEEYSNAKMNLRKTRKCISTNA
jgi:hypothetical protein